MTCAKCGKEKAEGESWGTAVAIRYCPDCAKQLGESCSECGCDAGNGFGGFSNCCGAPICKPLPKKVLWVSRHDLSPAQRQAIRDLHGDNTDVVKDPVVFTDIYGLSKYIYEHPKEFVYAVAGAPHYIEATLDGVRFGVFENHPAKRQDGTFGLAAVYHVNKYPGHIDKVWGNPDPASDNGEALLIPVLR